MRSKADTPVKTLIGEDYVSEMAEVNGTTLHYVRGGHGPAVILIHGFPQDWFEYHAIMPRLAKQFTVIAIDLRGVGGSAVAPDVYDAATMAGDVYQLAFTLELQGVYVVGHDIGGMVTYAFVRRYPHITRGAMILDVAIPGIDGWDEIKGDAVLWHIPFMQVPEIPERLVIGRQGDFFAYFYNFAKFAPEDIAHYLEAYATPEQLHAAFEMYRAFPANGQLNATEDARNDVPVFVGSGERSFFAKIVPKIAKDLRTHGFIQVESGLIPGGVHFLIEDQPEAVAELIERYASRYSDSSR